MSLAYTPDRLRLPDSLTAQLHEYRRRVWTIKMVEAVAAAAFGILVGYLVLFCLDRVWDTPGWLRVGLFIASAVACANIPWALHRWVWRHRRLEQLARLLARKHPRVGDQLLGIIELVRNDFEQARSPALCEAAIREVAHDARRRDFRDAVPDPRHRVWMWMVVVPMVTALARALALDAGWTAAIQNSVCTNLTMLSPIRISMGAAILSLVASDAALYRRAWPLAVPPLAGGVAAVTLLLYAPAS